MPTAMISLMNIMLNGLEDKMASRLNIGKIGAALEGIIRSSNLVNKGPQIDPMLGHIDYGDMLSAQADTEETMNVFVFGIHKWGDKKNLVG